MGDPAKVNRHMPIVDEDHVDMLRNLRRSRYVRPFNQDEKLQEALRDAFETAEGLARYLQLPVDSRYEYLDHRGRKRVSEDLMRFGKTMTFITRHDRDEGNEQYMDSKGYVPLDSFFLSPGDILVFDTEVGEETLQLDYDQVSDGSISNLLHQGEPWTYTVLSA